jgi:hypothetical protein
MNIPGGCPLSCVVNDYKTEQSTQTYEVKFEGIQVETLERHICEHVHSLYSGYPGEHAHCFIHHGEKNRFFS